MPTICLEERLGLTYKKLSYRPTGTRPSPRSVLAWKSAIKSTSLLLTGKPTLFSLWSLTEHTAPPLWVATSGRHWLAPRRPCRLGVTKKGSMQRVTVFLLKRESVFLEMIRETAVPVIPKSVLELEDTLMIPTRVETTLLTDIHRIMERRTSKPWVISLFSRVELTYTLLFKKGQ